MSIVSGPAGAAHIASILKTPIRTNQIAERTPNRVRFEVPDAQKIRTILQDYVNEANIRKYFDLVSLIKDQEINDEDLQILLSETKDCISLLNEDLRLFVEAILKLKWAHRSKTTVREYQSFLFDLLSAHNYYVKCAIVNIVGNFIPDPSEPEWTDGVPPDEEFKKYVNVHYVINILLKVIPMCGEIFLEHFVVLFPYFKKTTHQNEVYIHNLLWILDYRPEYRMEIFTLIFKKLMLMDVHAPRSEVEEFEDNDMEAMETETIFTMDDDKEDASRDMRHPLAHTLDVCLERLFLYLDTECHNPQTGELDWDKTKNLYLDMMKIFENMLLTTYGTSYIQYIIFYLCSFKNTLSEGLLNLLWKKVTDLNLAVVHRQSAIAYATSFLARAAFIPIGLLKINIERMAMWVHSYISSQDGLSSINSNIRVHMIFYSVCQALFYVVAFRHRDLIQSKKGLIFLQNLNLTKIVTSRLNPLRVCMPAIVQNFAAITRTYQLAYCYTIIEHNVRNNLPIIYKDQHGQMTTINVCMETFFPFDPYILCRSGKRFASLYVEYESSNSADDVRELENLTHTSNHDEDDDFLSETVNQPIAHAHQTSFDLFSYSTSPGFKTMN